ncbi:MAG: recombinase family protein, partial [Patescibacteria group bacterium]|nr:recombinase family protein [Patescibacteria group bacterium]
MSAVQKFQFGMSLGLAKYYSDAISDNVKRAFENKRRNGEWTGKVRIGYKNITLDNDKKDIILDSERAHLIKMLFELWATGNYSLNTIWKKITELGLKSERDMPLTRSNIAYILNDPFYSGMAHSAKYGFYPHKYPTIITRELFEKCQEVSRNRGRKPSKLDGFNDFIFKGLLTCKHCGCTMTPEIKRKKSGLTFIYYSCTNAKGQCKRVYVPQNALLKPIMADFEALQGIPDNVQARLTEELRKLNDVEADFHNRQVVRIRSEYEKVQNRIKVLLDMRLDQSITSDDYD